MPIDPTDLAKSIGALGSLDPEAGLGPTLQQIANAAKQLFAADGAGLMLVDAEGQLRWASASDQTAQTVEDGQERLAQGRPVRWRSASGSRARSVTSASSPSGPSSLRSCWARGSARP